MIDRSSTAIFVAKQSNTQNKNITGKNGHENQMSSGTLSTQTGITVVKSSGHPPPPSTGQDLTKHNSNQHAIIIKQKGLTNASGGTNSEMTASSQLGASINDNSIINASQSAHSTTASHITSEIISSQSQKGSSMPSNDKKQKFRHTIQQQSGPIVDSVKQQPLYQSTTQVLQARPIVPVDQQTHSKTKRQQQAVISREQPSNGENYPRVMQREKRQNKYVPKQVQMQSQQQQQHQQTMQHQQNDHMDSMTQMQYQPLRRPQQLQQNGIQQRGYELIDYTHPQHLSKYPNARGGHYANNHHTQNNTRRKHMHHHDHVHRAKLSSREEEGRIYQQHTNKQQTMGVSQSETSFATHVKIFNDSDTISRFQNHPVRAYKPGNVNKIAKAPNSNKQGRYVARLPQGNQDTNQRYFNNYDNGNRQLQSQQYSASNNKQNSSYFNQKGQACEQLRLHNNVAFVSQQQLLMKPDQQKVSSNQQKQIMQSNTLSQSQPFYPQQKLPQDQSAAANSNPSQSLRFNTAAIIAQNYSQSHQLQQHQLQQQVQPFARGVAQHQQSNLLFHDSGSHLVKSPATSSQPQFQHSQAYQASFVPSSPQLVHSATGNLFIPQQQQMWSVDPPASQNNGMRTGAPHQINQGYNNFPQSSQQPQAIQIVSNPLRVKTITPQKAQQFNPSTAQKQEKQAPTGNFSHTTSKAVVSQDTAAVELKHKGTVNEEMQKNQTWSPEKKQQSKEPYSKCSQTNKITIGTTGTSKNLTMGEQIQASTESAEEDEDQQTSKQKHQETFQCLTTCTEWYLVASVGNLQVKIPAKQTAVRFSENAQELPILTREYDLIDKLVDKEEAMSTSEKQIIQLNRAVGAGLNPSSSNNISNNGYRKKQHVVQAQSAYENKLKLNLVGDEEQEKQTKFPLHLPINNNSHEDNMRIIDLYMHHRTQQLMCIEFDMTHLKLDEEAEQSFSGEYSDNFSINPSGGSETAEQKEQSRQEQPTPFMGVPKNQGPYAYGQPQNVLYINESNKVANQLRVINQEYVERTTHFKLNGECHGKLVFEQDLKYQIPGKKIIKSIQERLIRAKEYIYNEIVRMEPTITIRNTSKTSSHGSNNSRQNVVTDEGRGANALRTHQRTQKSILGTLRGRNKRKKGPYLLRPDQIHIPVVNVTKSLGFKMLMPNLSSIDNMLTNFNQIVMQEGLIQSFFFSFDLPVHQLSTSTPAISNSLVVKIPRDVMGKNSPNGKHASNQYHQQNSLAAFLAYKQHHADHNRYHVSPGHQQQQQQHLQQQQMSSPQQLQVQGVPNEKKTDPESNQQPSSLWNLVDEFNKISTNTTPQYAQPEAPKVDQKKGPFTYQAAPVDQQLRPGAPGAFSSPFSQQIASSSISNYSNGSNPFQPHQNQPPQHILSQVSSLLNSGGDPQQQHQQQQPYLMSCGVSSQNSNLSFHQHSSYGPGNHNQYNRQHKLSPQQQLSEGESQGLFTGAGYHNVQTAPQQIQLQPNLVLPQPGGHNITLPQQFHQALYSLRDQFNPQFNVNGHQHMRPQSDYNISLQQDCPIYVPPEDPNYLSNLDRLLEAITPRVSMHQLDQTSITDFFKAFRKTSVFGLRVELLNEQTLQSEIFTFTPTLSSLVLSYHKPMLDGDGDKLLNRVLDFDGIDEIKSDKNQIGVSGKDNNLRLNGQEFMVPECQPKDLESSKPDLPPSYQQQSAERVESRSSSSVITQMSKPQLKFIEHHETDPHYQRPAFFTKIKEIIKDVPHLKQVMLKQSTFNFNVSWFSMLWTCQRVCTIPNADQDAEMLEQMGEDATDFSSSAVTNIQFLAIFRFRPESAANMTQSTNGFNETQKKFQRANANKESVQLIGLIPYKLDRESFWVSPSHLQTENNLQGEMYDQISEDNIILLQDLKERAIEFLQPQSRREDIHDFNHLLNSTNSSIFDFI